MALCQCMQQTSCCWHAVLSRSVEMQKAGLLPCVLCLCFAGAYLAPSFNDPSNSTAPAFTISGRPAGPSTDPAAALPGSGAYRAPELPKGPAYTLSGRQAAGYKGAGGQGPGPGAYDVTVGESGTPAWTIGARVADTEVSGELRALAMSPVDWQHSMPCCSAMLPSSAVTAAVCRLVPSTPPVTLLAG